MNTLHFLNKAQNWPAALSLAILLLCAGPIALAQTAATYAQHFAAMKMVHPALKRVGVLGSRLTERDMQDITRAAMTQGVEVYIGRPKNLRDIAGIYKTMVVDRRVSLLWLPDPDDALVTEEGFEFLRMRTLHDNLGLCVPNPSLLTSGGLMSVQREDKKLTIHINHRVAGLIGAATPNNSGGSIAFVSH